MVYTTHPRNPTIIMATDSGDALVQGFYECRGLLVTGTQEEDSGRLIVDHTLLAPAPVFAVTRWIHEADYPTAELARSYLWYLQFWHSAPTIPTKSVRPIVDMGASLVRDREVGVYPHVKQGDPRTEDQLAWYCAHLCHNGHFDRTRLLPARYVEFYSDSELGDHLFAYKEREPPHGKGVVISPHAMATKVAEPTEWAWYEGGKHPEVGVNRKIFYPEGEVPPGTPFQWVRANCRALQNREDLHRIPGSLSRGGTTGPLTIPGPAVPTEAERAWFEGRKKRMADKAKWDAAAEAKAAQKAKTTGGKRTQREEKGTEEGKVGDEKAQEEKGKGAQEETPKAGKKPRRAPTEKVEGESKRPDRKQREDRACGRLVTEPGLGDYVLKGEKDYRCNPNQG